MGSPPLAPAPAHIVGPTWQRLENGDFYLPEFTLGDEIVNWMWKYVVQPSGPRAGENFLVTEEQFRFLLWWYAIDGMGKFIYRNGLLRRLKGWGKDPLAAAMALAELCGPVQFSHWDEKTGRPVGKPKASAWIQIAAVSQDQTRNTFTLFPAMASKVMKEEFGLEVHKTIIYSRAGGMIESVTSSPLALEGKRPTFVIKNETQWWIESNQGLEMANIIRGNVTKGAYGTCRSLSICNAHRPGEESDAERDWDAWQQQQSGEAVKTGFLYDALEAPADTPVGEIAELMEDEEAYLAAIQRLREGLEICKGDADWLDTDTIVESILDVREDVTESRRKFLNQINAAEDAWVSPREWDKCLGVKLEPLRPGDRITMGFDGSKSSDWTALVACRVEDAAIFPIKIWNPEKYGGEVPREDVNNTVDWAFAQYDVVGFRSDVKEFESYVDAWGAAYGKKLKLKATAKHPVAYDMRSNIKAFTLDCERFQDAVLEQELVHNGDVALRRHVLNAIRRPNNFGISISKATKDSSRKIDAAVCAVLAFGARQEFLMSKSNKKKGVAILR
jgi:Phage terminase-like protein, large subunit